MISDPKIKALIDAGPMQFLTRRQRVERYLSWVLLVAVIGLTVGYFVVSGVAHQARSASDKASASVQASCQFWHDLAELPLSPQTTKTGFQIVADSYVAYAGLNCRALTGVLPAPSVSVNAQIPAGMRAQVLSSVR